MLIKRSHYRHTFLIIIILSYVLSSQFIRWKHRGERKHRKLKTAFNLLKEMSEELFQKHKISLSLEVSYIYNLEQPDLFQNLRMTKRTALSTDVTPSAYLSPLCSNPLNIRLLVEFLKSSASSSCIPDFQCS